MKFSETEVLLQGDVIGLVTTGDTCGDFGRKWIRMMAGLWNAPQQKTYQHRFLISIETQVRMILEYPYHEDKHISHLSLNQRKLD
jgi:hypothetical protein